MALHNTQSDLQRITKALTALTLLVLLATATPKVANAQGSDAQRRAAIAEAVEQSGGSGKVLSVKPYKQSNGQPGFRIRILTGGTVRTFDVPAATGQ